AAMLEQVNQEAEQTAVEAVDSEDITSDLEEVIVSEAVAAPPETLSAEASPLESALIPDQPMDEDEDETQTNDEDSLPVPSDPDNRLDLPPVQSSDVDSPLPGSEFDDDLDFYSLRSLENDQNASEDSSGNNLGTALETAGDRLPDDGGPDDGGPDDGEPDDDEPDPTEGQPTRWFLGIDVGTTGLSAVLMNRLGEHVYPLCWSIPGDSESNRFRLPAVAQVNPSSRQIEAVGPTALQQSDEILRNVKPLLKIGIPKEDAGEPWVQWSDQGALPLLSVQNALTALLKTLSPDSLSCRAVGLKNSVLRRALADLKGVIIGYPNNWPDTYSFNLREVVLAAGLVECADQVLFIDEAIAALLSALPDPSVEGEPLDEQPGLYNCHWSGGTVVISAGASLTEAAVVDLPADLSALSYSDFALRSFTYAGDSIDQDILCQLLHLPVGSQIPTQPSDPSAGWQSLGLDQLALPQVGEADRIKRHRLRQRLNDSPLGRQALIAVRELKRVLQEEDEFALALGDRSWTITRSDLETKVFLPYIQRLNRQINGLLSQQGLSAQAVKQVVCTGGSASLSTIARWLRQKFPNATIIQDTYSGEYSNSCSRVAYGLANLCHYPRVLDANRHQYNDYFLLLELLRILPDQPLPAAGILHLLEQRGINTQTCQSHILALIEGHLPPGLVPTEGDRPMISAQSPDINSYRALAELPLFKKQGGQIYIADPQQGDRLRTHLESVLATKAQTLSEPLSVQLNPENVLAS
ncbi:MAG: hypothetical protein WBD47_08440, partial [Phormidesmis sp.]